MSAYGRWREVEEQKFEAWWKKFLAKGWLRALKKLDDGTILTIEPRDDNEVGLAHDAALNAWMAAKWKEAPDD
jgi:hypothetical protein